jgi:hypothetical protein
MLLGYYGNHETGLTQNNAGDSKGSSSPALLLSLSLSSARGIA